MAVWRRLAAAVALLMATSASAQELRPLCTDRPGLGTPACVVDEEHLLAELGLGDFERNEDATMRTDRFVAGDLLLRYGIGPSTEVQLGWTAFGKVRERDLTTGSVERRSGVGDVEIAVVQSLSNPDGSGTAISVRPFATLPVGGSTIGAGDWGAGLVVPVSFALNDRVSLQFSPEVDAAVDEDGEGRHLGYGSVTGLSLAVSDAVEIALEASAFRDRDPAGHVTALLGAMAVTWQSEDDLLLDCGVVAGLNRASADFRVYAGVSRRF